MALIVVIAALVLALATLRMVMVTPPARLAAFLRRAWPVALVVGGAGLTLVGRPAFGLPLVGLGLAAYRRAARAGPATASEGDTSSQVRSAFLQMTLDHASGDLDGRILAGRAEGRLLSALTETELRALHAELAADVDSLRLLEAYLDRRVPGWRADAKANAGDGLGSAPGAGPMTEQQAYEILGLDPGATIAEIREAHRRLMKRVHPDHGGTDFLAARINEAKAFLIERHR